MKLESQKFLELIKKGRYALASEIVIALCQKDQRVDLVLKTIKNTPLRCHTQMLSDIDRIILSYRNGNLTDLKLEVIIGRLKSDIELNGDFYDMMYCILRDLRYDEWEESDSAVALLAGHYKNKSYVKDLLFEAAEMVWPKKGLMVAIYG